MNALIAMRNGVLRAAGDQRGWLLAAALVVLLALAFPGVAADTGRFVVENLIAVAPMIALAVLLSAYLRASGGDGRMARAFEGHPLKMILIASFIGAITPVCGIGVLPIIAGLLGAGVPLAPIMAFWLASPITDPAMLTITVATLGWSLALAKTVGAFAIGLGGGLATELALRRGHFAAPLKTEALRGHETACDTGCGAAAVRWRFWDEPARRRVFTDELLSTGLRMVKWLTLAFVLESLLRSHLPPEIIAGHVGAETAWAIPIAVTIGTPIYVDGYASLPFVRGLIELGMAPGAALAFLISGGITSIYASAAVFALVRLPLFLWYLALAVIGSAITGYAYEAVLAVAT